MSHRNTGDLDRPLVVPITDVHKIAVLRASALGDFILALPALVALRVAYPEAEIVLLGTEQHASFLTNRPAPINRVAVIPSCADSNTESGREEHRAALGDFIKCMALEHFDLAIQMHSGDSYANVFIQRLGAQTTIGLKTPEADPLDHWVPYIHFQPEILRCLELVSLVGAPTVTIDPHIVVTQRDREEASPYIPQDGQPLAILHPGASNARFRWAPEKFAEVGDALATAGAHVAVTGCEQESELTAAVVKAMHAPADDLCGYLSSAGLAGLLEYAKVVVANDTGLMYMAHAVGSKTVGIYWAYNAMVTGPLTRCRHRPVITWQMLCPVCHMDNTWQHCEHDVSFVNDILAENVITPALELLFSN